MKVNAFTSAVMCCRKLLMNVAVSEGAKERQTFKKYVEYLVAEGHIPANTTKWVDHIRDKGNEANHEIALMGRKDAEQLIKFSEMVLQIMYGYPAEVDSAGQQGNTPTQSQTEAVETFSNPPTTPPGHI